MLFSDRATGVARGGTGTTRSHPPGTTKKPVPQLILGKLDHTPEGKSKCTSSSSTTERNQVAQGGGSLL